MILGALGMSGWTRVRSCGRRGSAPSGRSGRPPLSRFASARAKPWRQRNGAAAITGACTGVDIARATVRRLGARTVRAAPADLESMDGQAKATGTAIFWGEVAPCEHLVQVYK